MYPKFLYRYRPLGFSTERDEQEISSIQKSYLWFSLFNQLNDPAELGIPNLSALPDGLESHLDSISEGLSEIARVQWRMAKHRAASLLPKESSSICCFSEIGVHQAMWAYYANNYTGFCIKYDVAKLISLTGLAWGNRCFAVEYQDERNVYPVQYMNPNPNEVAPSSVLTKHTDWAHEKEWRLFNRNSNGVFYHTANAIDEITLGPRASEAHYLRMKEVAKSMRIRLSTLTFENYTMSKNDVWAPSTERTFTACELTNLAKSSRQSILEEGIDEESLDSAIGVAQHYPGASKVGYLFLSDEGEPELNAHIYFDLPNGGEQFKTLRFKLTNNVVSKEYEYLI